ncbi:MAG: hypothetical protein ACOY5C_07075 [Pseudomonadota bacterium]
MSGNSGLSSTTKKFAGLLIFFLPEVTVLIIWLLFRSSLIEVRNVMMTGSIDVASTRLVAISAISLMIIQWLRIYPFRLNSKTPHRERPINLTGLVIFAFILLGVASELPNIHNIMTESYLSVTMSFITMAGAVYLLTELFAMFVSRTLSIIRGK